MKVLDFDSIKRYDFMANSLSFVAMGDLEEAVISAYEHLRTDAKDDKARLDISMYIAKLYTKMGEIDASINLLFRLLRLRMEEGRVYTLIAYDYHALGDMELARLYTEYMHDWNRRNGDILEVDSEYILDFSKPKVEVKTPASVDRDIMDRATNFAFSGDTAQAREELKNVSDMGKMRVDKLRLLMAIDRADGTKNRDTDILLRRIIESDIDIDDVFSLVSILETLGRYDDIIDLIGAVKRSHRLNARLRYIEAVAMANTHQKGAIKVIDRLAKAYGYVYPYMATARYILAHNKGVTLPIYERENVDSDLRLIRDSEVCRVVMNGNISRIDYDLSIYPLIMGMYEDGYITDAMGYVTRVLLESKAGREVLQDVLLDRETSSAKTKVYVARNLVERERTLSVVYEDVYLTETLSMPEGLSNIEAKEYKDRFVYDLISGN